MDLKNAWYVAAWSEEVSREMMTRTICEEPILLYRKENGDPVAIGKARRMLRRLIAKQDAGEIARPGHRPLKDLIAETMETANPVLPVV